MNPWTSSHNALQEPIVNKSVVAPSQDTTYLEYQLNEWLVQRKLDPSNHQDDTINKMKHEDVFGVHDPHNWGLTETPNILLRETWLFARERKMARRLIFTALQWLYATQMLRQMPIIAHDLNLELNKICKSVGGLLKARHHEVWTQTSIHERPAKYAPL